MASAGLEPSVLQTDRPGSGSSPVKPSRFAISEPNKKRWMQGKLGTKTGPGNEPSLLLLTAPC
ncbi:hypothetical protein CCMA1212_005923 [Trichoderma ghanense]|uniref:Uncharacterized protein n=1 Tax=Trichoderma ghanense TaxID=65468 RepID=A0ABY2H285_9HYPO